MYSSDNFLYSLAAYILYLIHCKVLPCVVVGRLLCGCVACVAVYEVLLPVAVAVCGCVWLLLCGCVATWDCLWVLLCVVVSGC